MVAARHPAVATLGWQGQLVSNSGEGFRTQSMLRFVLGIGAISNGVPLWFCGGYHDIHQTPKLSIETPIF